MSSSGGGGAPGAPVLHAVADGVRPIGRLFLNLLQMVVIPLVAAALFTGVAGLGDVRRLGRLGSRTLGFFWATTLAAIALGFAVAGIILPLIALSPEHQAQLRALGEDGAAAAPAAAGGLRFLVDLVPANAVRAAVDGQLLPLIVFVTIFAAAAASLPAARRAPLIDLADAVPRALIRVVHWVLLLAPFGIFALVAPAIALGFGSMRSRTRSRPRHTVCEGNAKVVPSSKANGTIQPADVSETRHGALTSAA